MMLGFPPPLFFQICWRFVSPAIIFVSSQAGAPWQASSSPHGRLHPRLLPRGVRAVAQTQAGLRGGLEPHPGAARRLPQRDAGTVSQMGVSLLSPVP